MELGVLRNLTSCNLDLSTARDGLATRVTFDDIRFDLSLRSRAA